VDCAVPKVQYRTIQGLMKGCEVRGSGSRIKPTGFTYTEDRSRATDYVTTDLTGLTVADVVVAKV